LAEQAEPAHPRGGILAAMKPLLVVITSQLLFTTGDLLVGRASMLLSVTVLNEGLTTKTVVGGGLAVAALVALTLPS
jgi:hypothetical protein